MRRIVWLTAAIVFFFGVIITGIVILATKGVDQNKTSRVDELSTNRQFLEKFFTYGSTKERYESIKPYMTEVGYRSTFPSGVDVPTSNQNSVESVMSDLMPYRLQLSKNEALFLNEFKIKTTFKGISDTESVLVRTDIVFVKDEGWLVNEVEFIGQTSGR